MPLRYVNTLTGLSTTNGYPVYFPDVTIASFNLSVACVAGSTTLSFSVEHSLDYGSSVFVSTAATWYKSSGIDNVSSGNTFTAYTYPVSAVRLNSTAGSSTATVTMTIQQAG